MTAFSITILWMFSLLVKFHCSVVPSQNPNPQSHITNDHINNSIEVVVTDSHMMVLHHDLFYYY